MIGDCHLDSLRAQIHVPLVNILVVNLNLQPDTVVNWIEESSEKLVTRRSWSLGEVGQWILCFIISAE